MRDDLATHEGRAPSFSVTPDKRICIHHMVQDSYSITDAGRYAKWLWDVGERETYAELMATIRKVCPQRGRLIADNIGRSPYLTIVNTGGA